MNRIVLGFMFSSMAAMANAQAPAPDPTATNADAVMAASEEPVATVEVAAPTTKPEKNDRYCVRDTGTRIKQRDKNGCVAISGRSYSRDDLDSTGAVDLSDALQLLDPSISVHH